MLKRWLSLSVLLPILGFFALVLAMTGWSIRGLPLDAVIFKSVGVLGAGGEYAEPTKWRPNAWLEAARWTGILFFILTAYKAFGLLVSTRLRVFRYQIAKRDIVLVGDAVIFADLSAALEAKRGRVLWLSGGAVPECKNHIPSDCDKKSFKQFRLNHARLVIVCFESDDSKALTAARDISSLNINGRVILFNLTFTSGTVFRRAIKECPVQVSSPTHATLRTANLQHPPFLKASELGHERLHALIIGCGDTGEQVFIDLILSCRTTFLGKPLITIVDPRATEIQASFAARYPEVANSVDLQWITSPGSEDARALPCEKLAEAAKYYPVSVAYVCLRGDRKSLAAAVTLSSILPQINAAGSTIYVHQQSSVMLRDGTDTLESDIIPFGTANDIIKGLGLLEQDYDKLPKALHNAHNAARQRSNEFTSSVVVDWLGLPESIREANRSVLSHIPAKIASAAHELGLKPGSTNMLIEAVKVPTVLERLASLEHQRWEADRHLAGWRYAATRDDSKRLHSDLVAYNRLSEQSREYDRQIVRMVAAANLL